MDQCGTKQCDTSDLPRWISPESISKPNAPGTASPISEDRDRQVQSTATESLALPARLVKRGVACGHFRFVACLNTGLPSLWTELNDMNYQSTNPDGLQFVHIFVIYGYIQPDCTVEYPAKKEKGRAIVDT